MQRLGVLLALLAAVPALAHRLVLDPRAAGGGLDAAAVVCELLASTPLPR